jgi:hypothetical protein
MWARFLYHDKGGYSMNKNSIALGRDSGDE